jgi:hypothetical protein
MAELGVTAVVVGTILLALGLIPGLVPTVVRGFQSLGDRFSSWRDASTLQTSLTLSGDVWLISSGGVLLLLGLLVLLC